MLRNLVLSAVIVGVGSLALQRQINGQTEPVTYYDFTKTAGEPYGPYPMTWMVVSATNSLALAVVPGGFHQTPHHHDQEQFTLGVEGPLEYSIGGTVHHIGPNGAGIPLANVQHGMTNDSDRPVMMLEFQPVRRDDWLPPHPQVVQPQSAQPMPIDPAERVTIDYSLSSDGWRSDGTGARVKSLAGRTIRTNFWDLSAAHSMVDVTAQPSANERFIFVLSGRLASQVGSSRREIGARTAIVVSPSAREVQLQSLAAAGTAVVVFERIGQ
jgi:quercetin dioxygenase-like cupin family protein